LEEKRSAIETFTKNQPETNTEVVSRISDSTSEAVINAESEEEASMILIPWNKKDDADEAIYSTDIKDIMWNVEVPVALLKTEASIDAIERIVFVVAARTTGVKLKQDSIDFIQQLGKALDIPIIALSTVHYLDRLRDAFNTDDEDSRNQLIEVQDPISEQCSKQIKENDLVVITSMGSKKRFEKGDDQVPAEILDDLETSVMIMNFP
jgi:hypothetical protein